MLLPLAAISLWTYWVEPCPRPAELACQAADAELAGWALEAWAAASSGKLQFVRVPEEQKARLRFYWAGARPGMYGEARAVRFEGRLGAEIYLRPGVAAGTDPLLRDAVVYLTCLHESGHALGLGHTADFDDIMYSFQFGGDLEEYFARYRRKLKDRSDIRAHSGLSARDIERIRQMAPRLDRPLLP
jgi:hypothetical protein